MGSEGRTYRLSIMVDLQDRMQAAMQKVTGTAEKFEQRLQNTARAAQMLDRQKIAPVIDGKDRLSSKVSTAAASLRGLTSKTWTVTLRAKDEVTKVTNRLGNALTSSAGIVGIGAATVGASALVGGSLSKAMDFEAQLSSIQALTGATGDEMDRVKALALKLGAATKYSALEAAQGFEELLKAGLSVEQVENGGAEAALNLATAGGLGLAEAAEIMSTAMNAFKADGMSAAQAANILAGTANASATGVSELKFSLAAVSAVASGVGMSFQDVNAALGVFANNGLKGSDAGTSLKTMLMNLIPDSKKAITEFGRLGLLTEQGTSAFFDQEGRLKSLTDIADLLRNSMAGMTDEQRLLSMQTMFGSDAIRAANILYKEGADGIKKFTAEMNKVTALEVAKKKMDNARGAIEQLKGSFETMQIRVMTPFLPLISKIANGIGDSIDGAVSQIEARSQNMAAQLNGFIDELAGDEKFQAMDWGDKIVYVLDRMIEAVDKWSSGPGGDQFGKVFTKLAEIGMRSWMAALGGMMKGSLNSLFSGNITGAIGLALGANFLGAGSLIKGGYSLGKGMLGGGKAASTVSASGPALLPRVADVRAGYELMSPGASRTSSLFSGFKLASEGTRIGSLMESIGTQGTRMMGWASGLANSPLGALAKRAILPLGIGLDAYNVSQAREEDRGAAVGGMAGRWGGAWLGGKAGAAAGALAGSVVPGVGTAAGALVGGIGGSIAGFFAGGKIGEYIGDMASKFDFAPVKAKIFAAKDEMVVAVSSWFDALPERVGYAVGYSLTWLSQLPSRGAAYFSQLVNDADAYISALPGRLEAWWEQTYSGAAAWISQTVDDTSAWFGSLPGMAEAAWQSLWQAVETWAANSYNSVVSWFSNLGSMISRYFDEAISAISSKMGGIWGGLTSGFSAGQSAAGGIGHAAGGIFDTPHIAMFAEEGAESIIPLNPNRRARALDLWQRTGEALGVRQYADGGITGIAAALPFPGMAMGMQGGNFGDIIIENIALSFGSETDEETLVMRIGRMILDAAKRKAENSAD